MEQPTLVLTPGFLDDLMNGKASIIDGLQGNLDASIS